MGWAIDESPTEIHRIAHLLLRGIELLWILLYIVFKAGYTLNQVHFLDATPRYFGMASDQTLHFKGEKFLDGKNTGHQKSRFIVILRCSADGRMVTTLVVFKGLNNVPRLNLSPNIEVSLSMGRSMNVGLML